MHAVSCNCGYWVDIIIIIASEAFVQLLLRSVTSPKDQPTQCYSAEATIQTL